MRCSNKYAFFLIVHLIGFLFFFSAETSASYIGEGQKFFFKEDYEQALYYFKKGVEKQPDNAMLLYYLGQTYFKIDELHDARASFYKALKHKPDYTIARLQLARCCYKLGDIACAKKQFAHIQNNKPKELDPSDMDIISRIHASPLTVKKEQQQPASNKDNTPPKIIITSPTTTRGIFIAIEGGRDIDTKGVLVKGHAIDESGVSQVLINGNKANLQPNGEFWADVFLVHGDNRVTVTATDVHRNHAEKMFTILRRELSAPQPAVSTRKEASLPVLTTGTNYALIIAVQDYEDPSIIDLDNPIQDAQQVKKTLLRHYTFAPDHVFELINPDRASIINTFVELSRKTTPRDSLLIFYAGHSYWDNKFKLGYWLPSNAAKNNRSEWLSNSTIRDFIKGIESKHILLIADACFSGSIFKTRSAFSDVSPAIQQLYKMPSRKAMTSGTLTEVPDNSVFVEYFLKRLQTNTDRYLTSQQLFSSFRQAVINNSQNNQVPQYGVIHGSGDEGGDFIFVKRE